MTEDILRQSLAVLVEELRAEYQRIRAFHATMGTGYAVAADRIGNLLMASPAPDYLKQLERLWADVSIAQAVWCAHPDCDMDAALEVVLEAANQRREDSEKELPHAD